MSKKASQLIKKNQATKNRLLDLSDCELTSIPKEILAFTWVEQLIIVGNPMTHIDLEAIKDMRNLKEFYFDEEQATKFPDIRNLVIGDIPHNT